MKESGVTLLELLVTLTIIMILASVALPLGRVSGKRTHEIELRQHLRSMRAAIDTFKMEWNRDADVLIGPLCVKNKLSCKDVTSVYGYPRSMEKLLGVKLTSEEATIRGTAIRRYLRNLPLDTLKIARECHGHKADNLDDIEGYAHTLRLIAEARGT